MLNLFLYFKASPTLLITMCKQELQRQYQYIYSVLVCFIPAPIDMVNLCIENIYYILYLSIDGNLFTQELSSSSSSSSWYSGYSKIEEKLHYFNLKVAVLCSNQFRTCTKVVNLCLSSAGLPLLAGYSQSRSRPSKPRSLRNSMESATNSCLLAAVETIAVKGGELKVQPPTANRVFKLGLICFKALILSYLCAHKYITFRLRIVLTDILYTELLYCLWF